MSYATTYATPEVLGATWEAVSPGATGGAIESRPYPTAAPSAGGGFAMPAPPVNPLDGFDDLNGTRFIDTSGNVQWMPTREEIAAARRHGLPLEGIDYGRLDGMDGSYAGRPPRPVRTNPSASIGRAASGSLDDVMRGVGGAGGLATGGLLAGGIAGYAEYQSGGGVASAVAVGVGAGVGSAVGTVVGGIAGSALGPVGTVVGGMIGGAIGSALGGAIGDALIPDANLNGAQVLGTSVLGNSPVDYLIDFKTFSPSGAVYVEFQRVVKGPFSQSIVVSQLGSLISEQIILTGPNVPGNMSQMLRKQYYTSGLIVCQNGRIVLTRLDGQSDPVPYDPNTRDRPATGTPDFRLPGVDLPRPRPIFGNPRLRDPNPFGEPSPEPNPDPTDDPYPYPYPWPRPTPTPGPTPDPAPYPDPTDDPNPNPNPDNEDGQCDPCAKLDEILEKLDELEPPILTIPEHWPLRRGAERPQLIVVYSSKNQDGSWGNTRYQFSIPWFDHRKRRTLKTSLPRSIRKGAKQSTLLLTDNSKMTLFCSTHSEAERVLKLFENLVVTRYRTRDVRHSDLNGNGKREYKRVTVYPFVAKYYPAGMRDIDPVWTDKLY